MMDRVQAYMDGPRLLRMHLGELVPLVRVELRSYGWGLASLPSLHSLAWNCTLRVGWLTPPLVYMVWVGAAPPLVPLVSIELHSWGRGLASLPSWHSLAWNCALRVRWLTPSPGIGVGVACVRVVVHPYMFALCPLR